ncbi:uncharacterized protein LOC130049706 [Ostrea edulis]|uniref:uncharacterized protein LOC130049705 n=1 Tax=Ostrea edulis TaxID=37623 RepID=UPI0024AF3192|nr:uncharacterized protein LOC130049705 [Ostrea edulis]XP_056003620.1 uncharacterized protein LOC130049706 [Ostrea edulis]
MDLKELTERHLDLQTRSMRDTLVISGIIETDEEDTEAILKKFIEQELQITDDIQFDRVHRVGRRLRNKHRPIVAKFVLCKDRERVRKAALRLAGKLFSISELFPREINERHKLLYPQYKLAKQQGRRVTMIADKLFINGNPVHVNPRPIHQPNHLNSPYRSGAAESRAAQKKSVNAPPKVG